MNADCATEIFADVLVKFQAAEFFLRVTDALNRRHGAFDLANHFFDGERFLRCLDATAQELKNFLAMFHCNASKFFDKQPPKRYNEHERRLDGFGGFNVTIVAYRSVFRNVDTKIFKLGLSDLITSTLHCATC